MRFLSIAEALQVHRAVIDSSGGAAGIRDLPAFESALAQPRATFGGADLYPTVIEKAAALGFSIVRNHPFVDGNKRTGHASMEVFLLLNGFELDASVDEQEDVIVDPRRRETGSGRVHAIGASARVPGQEVTWEMWPFRPFRG
ncbi:MAG: type II toxin-antitoxin system death-on-curing family toxin [Deferrisomatales bacterium]|nr:type II toxin-antitoxin system death-on-curing family toxin [Deferrisomatales bacterium]